MESTVLSDSDKGLLECVRKSNPSPFLLKTYILVEDANTNDFISWNEQGTGFVVWQPVEFARDLLPTVFKHSNFSSFVRQLNTYGFRKVATNRWEFCNDLFRKGEKGLLCDIRRRKAWVSKQQLPAQKILEYDEDDRRSSSTSSSGYTTLIDENKRLKEENGMLNLELTCVRKKCNELLDLVAKHSHEVEGKKGDHHRPKLFGVTLDVQGERDMKRKRAEVDERASILVSQL